MYTHMWLYFSQGILCLPHLTTSTGGGLFPGHCQGADQGEHFVFIIRKWITNILHVYGLKKYTVNCLTEFFFFFFLACRSYDSSDAENPGNNLYVTGLSARVTKRDLEKHFSTEGMVWYLCYEAYLFPSFFISWWVFPDSSWKDHQYHIELEEN